MRRRPSGALLALLAACGASQDAGEPAPMSLPAPRAGLERLGESRAELRIEEWIGEPLGFARGAGATLLRWWTDTCPYCEASLLALERLRRDFEASGLETVAVYHPKSGSQPSAQEIAAAARERGYTGRLAIDREWQALDTAWPAAERTATSVSLLLDRDGVVRFVHPGPEFHPSTEPDHRQCARDFADLRKSIETLLAGLPR